VTIVDREEVVAALDEEWDALAALAAELEPSDWALPTACPGWTVKEQFSHVLAIEAMLLGRPAPEVALPPQLDHVHNEMGRVNELWAEHYRAVPVTDLLADLGEVIISRRAALATMTQDDFDAPAMTPAGQDTYGRFMRIRVMDQWIHEQDVRIAAGRPGHLEGRAPRSALAEVRMSLGYAVGKKAGAPKGSSVRFVLTGPINSRLDVVVDDRAQVVDLIRGTPTATIEVPGDAFIRIGAGRVPEGEAAGLATRLDGDRALGEQILNGLAYMI
jgi:uncharacterized protein (TIGR03083 family)